MLLFKVTEKDVLVPCCTVPEDGPAVMVKADDATTLKLVAETPDWLATVTVIGPDAPPDGIVKASDVEVKVDIGA